ncbi:hypothetical protein J437_LFUL005185 [Ladona fulva]|uniref:J domain-containing protein n=1 Tax=Ladona fulva TaxID=123851 RepID=A0A8K0P9N4_LADFU|nr:hypothetical protein J437_LFUL005185 [Ladona fulva]
MSGIDGIISYKRNEDEDYYKILGCSEDSSPEQINTEYKVRALQFHPDKNDGNKEAEAKFQQLKEAKEILCDPERRAHYDKWRRSGIAISYKQWCGMKEHVQQAMHWSIPKTKDRMLEPAAPSDATSQGPSRETHRRASEGGTNIHYGNRNTGGVKWESKPPNEVVSKFRNYEI